MVRGSETQLQVDKNVILYLSTLSIKVWQPQHIWRYDDVRVIRLACQVGPHCYNDRHIWMTTSMTISSGHTRDRLQRNKSIQYSTSSADSYRNITSTFDCSNWLIKICLYYSDNYGDWYSSFWSYLLPLEVINIEMCQDWQLNGHVFLLQFIPV